MPKIHEIEGKNYYLVTDIDGKYLAKADVESTIAERTSAAAKKARDAEARATTAEADLAKANKRLKTVDTLADQVTELQGKLASAESRYERHTAISGAGITDPDVRELVEWQYERATKDLGDKAPTLADWLGEQVKAPDKAPSSLRPHLQGLDTGGKGGTGDEGKGGKGTGEEGGKGTGNEGKNTLSVQQSKWASSALGLQQAGGGTGEITLDAIADAKTEADLAAMEKAAGF